VLTGGSSITGGTINDYTPSAGTGGTIHVTGNAGLFGVSGSNLLQLYNGNVTVDSAATFTLDDVSVSATSFSDSGTLQVGSTHKLTLSSVTATGGAFTNAGTLSGTGKIDSATLINTGTITASGGTLQIVPNITGSGGVLQIAAGATLQLDGSTAQQINFLGGTDTLVLNDTAGSGAGSTVKARSGTNNGTFTIQGMGNVDTSQTGGSGGNAIDFSNLAGATSAVININTGGALTGVARGISVTQNGSGNIAITPSGNVTGNGGNAIFAQNNGASGNITVDPTATVTTSGSNAAAIFAQVNGGSGNITIDPTGTVTANAGSGISAQEIGGTGNITIGASGTVTGNAGTGIFALNTGATGNILINGTGNVTGSGSSTANGIGAQFTNANNAANVFNNGTITVTQSGNISGAQDGIDVADANFINTVAQAAGSGTISVTAGNTAGNAVLTGSSRYGIGAFTGGTGSITVETLAGTTINSGASGIIPVNQAPASVDFTGANSTITVTARGTINSGSNNNANGSEPAGIDAGYLAATGSNVFGNVTVDNFATITAAKGGGILAFMNGTGSGDVRVTDEAGSTITALNSATNVTTGASNPVGIKATSNGTGSITVITSASDGTHAGSIIDSGGSGIIAKNQSTSIPASAHSTISVTAAGSSSLAPSSTTTAPRRPESMLVTEAAATIRLIPASMATSASTALPTSRWPTALLEAAMASAPATMASAASPSPTSAPPSFKQTPDIVSNTASTRRTMSPAVPPPGLPSQ
jgi:hypothetical protein